MVGRKECQRETEGKRLNVSNVCLGIEHSRDDLILRCDATGTLVDQVWQRHQAGDPTDRSVRFVRRNRFSRKSRQSPHLLADSRQVRIFHQTANSADDDIC